jgi:hypothetical protein
VSAVAPTPFGDSVVVGFFEAVEVVDAGVVVGPVPVVTPDCVVPVGPTVVDPLSESQRAQQAFGGGVQPRNAWLPTTNSMARARVPS